MRYLEIYTNRDRVEKTRDISKVIPFELIDSTENTVLDPEIQKNGGIFELDTGILDSYGRKIYRIVLPPITTMKQEGCHVLDDIQMRFNTVMKVHEQYRHNECESKTLQSAIKSYLERGLADSIWGKKGAFMKICISTPCPHSFRAVALPNANYGIDEIGIPKEVMLASDRKHGDFALITRFPAIWDGSIEILKIRATNNDCIEIHPLLHKQFNLDHDGDNLTGYNVPDTEECIQEAKENVLSFFKQSKGSWPSELCMNGYEKTEYDTSDIEQLKKETKERLVSDGLSIDPLSLINQDHNLDEITGKDYKEKISSLCKGIDFDNFYDKSIDINIKNLTMKMFLGPVGTVSNEVKLVGSKGPDHVRRSAMRISEALQQSLMDSKHEVGSANNMRFMKVKDAIRAKGTSKPNAHKILKTIEENGLDVDMCAPFILYMYVFKPMFSALNQVYEQYDVSETSRIYLNSYYDTLLNSKIDHSKYPEMVNAFAVQVGDYTKCKKSAFKELVVKNLMPLSDYINDNFPVYRLSNKSSDFNSGQNVNDLCTRVIMNNENDIYGCCAEEFSKFGE